MKNYLRQFLKNKFLSRWVVLAIDLMIISTAFVMTWLVYYSITERPYEYDKVILQMLFGLPILLVAIQIFKPHHGIIRHTALHDTYAILKMHLIATATIFLFSAFLRTEFPFLNIHWAIFILHFFLSVMMLVFFRILVHIFYLHLNKDISPKRKVLIFGAGQMGLVTRNIVSGDASLSYEVAGFIDDNPQLRGKIIQGVTVFSTEEAFEKIIPRKEVKEIILAINPNGITVERKREFVDKCLDSNILVKEVPATWKWINGTFGINQIQTVKIEDLLGREVITLNNLTVLNGIRDRRIMVTGSAGSIGSEIVRQLSKLRPAEIILVDIAETALFELCQEVCPANPDVTYHQVLANVSDEIRMRMIFNEYHPEIIYHASAYKHVPMMEAHPYEAVKNNVKGAKVVADLAQEFGVSNFVMVSTDKAVNPTNIMGASKRMCEIYIQSLSKISGIKTRFITTRFGNVLGSNGSVIPIFRRQIAHGGPVTITHKDIIRYFMTIPEASQLVIEAGFMGQGGEIFLFDMGEPVKIYDLAEKMISLAGFIPHRDIQIVETGLRPGEKLFEELLADSEQTVKTHHEKILIARIRNKDYPAIRQKIDNLVKALPGLNNMEIVRMMKDIIPGFISNNSVYETLDQTNGHSFKKKPETREVV
jgi:FlaA1/EpsC-like NDP-sugar epimerase